MQINDVIILTSITWRNNFDWHYNSFKRQYANENVGNTQIFN